MDADIESLKKGRSKLRALLYVLFAVLAVSIAVLVYRSGGTAPEVNADAFLPVGSNRI